MRNISSKTVGFLSYFVSIEQLNKIASRNGVGRIDHVEDRLVGIKSRETYECPAATVLTQAHRSLEFLTLQKDVLEFKKIVEQRFSQLDLGHQSKGLQKRMRDGSSEEREQD